MSRKKELKISLSNAAVGARLRKLREDHLDVRSRREFAKKLGVPPTTIANYERGVCSVSTAVVERLVAFFRVSPRWLFHGTGSPLLSNPDIEAMSGAECGANLLVDIWDELGKTKTKLATYERGDRAALSLKESEEAAPYTPAGGKAPLREVAAILRAGERIKIRRIEDAPEPLGRYNGGEDEAQLI